jgi:hypothetical protein
MRVNPHLITPLAFPFCWPRNFVEELRRLSSVTRGQHEAMVRLLVETAEGRQKVEGEGAVAQITAGDVRSLRERVRLAGWAVEELEEVRGNDVFVVGLREGWRGLRWRVRARVLTVLVWVGVFRLRCDRLARVVLRTQLCCDLRDWNGMNT